MINGRLIHTMSSGIAEDWIVELAQLLEEADIPATAGVNETAKALQLMDRGIRRSRVSGLVDFRRRSARAGEPPGTL
jgi:hypothetical protein